MKRLEGYRNFCNKLWNASRYVLMNRDKGNPKAEGNLKLSLADRWIRTKLQYAIRDFRAAVDSFRLSRTRRTLPSRPCSMSLRPRSASRTL